MSALLRGSSCLTSVAIGWQGVVHDAVAAGADNAYVSVGSGDASATYAIDSDFYLLSRNADDKSTALVVIVSAKDPFKLVSPESGRVDLAPGGVSVYRVQDESGTEDTFTGLIRVLKLDIEPEVFNACQKAGSGTLHLTSDSYPGGTVIWSSSPSGIGGTSRSVGFNPSRLSAGEYVVTARSARFPSLKDTCIVRIFEIELVTPDGDPVSAPLDSGDGQNEFTYSSDSPGVLTMNLKAKVTPSAATAEIAEACTFRVGSIGVSVQEWARDNPYGQAAVRGDSLVATVTFTGLPEGNSNFGKKSASITFNDIPCDEKAYEVFFPKEAKNHPSGQPDSPNWFYYWKQGNVCSIPAKAKYEPRSGIYGSWSPSHGLVLSDLAAQSDDGPMNVSAKILTTNITYEIRHKSSSFADVKAGSSGVAGEEYFVVGVIKETEEQTRRIQIGGEGKGIGCVAMTVKHELGHQDMHERWVSSLEIVGMQRQSEERAIATYGYDSLEAAVARQVKMERLFSYGDQDDASGDGVPDGRERNGDDGVYSNDFDKDTFRLSDLFAGDYDEYGDEEVRMRKLEAEDLSDMYHEDLDWANPGCQHKNKFGPR